MKNDGHKWRDYDHTHRQQQQFNSTGHSVLLTTTMVINTGKQKMIEREVVTILFCNEYVHWDIVIS